MSKVDLGVFSCFVCFEGRCVLDDSGREPEPGDGEKDSLCRQRVKSSKVLTSCSLGKRGFENASVRDSCCP